MKSTINIHCAQSRAAHERSKSMLVAVLLGVLLLSTVSVALPQAYGVRRTAVVHTPNRTVVASKTTVATGRGTVVAGRTTVVAGGAALPHGYIAVLPGGYRAVVVSGSRYYTVGGIYYRPQMYGGRTVYVRVHI